MKVVADARVVRLHGAASAVDGLVTPRKATVEQATGLTLVVERSNAGKGLIDLVEARCDAALAAASLETTVQAARAAGLSGELPPDLRLHVVTTSEIVFVVHPSNRVRALTWEQLRAIHTGEVSSWKELGGDDRAITVYTDAAASATRGLVKRVVMGGQEYGAGARALEAVRLVNDAVAKDSTGIGALGREHVVSSVVVVVESLRVERPLGLITVGPPTAAVRAVLEALGRLRA